MTTSRATQDELYSKARAGFSAALERLARGYEADPEARRDLLQEIHIALWRSFEGFNGLCSLRTWVYRVAHKVAATHVLRRRRLKFRKLVSLEELEDLPDSRQDALLLFRHSDFELLLSLIRELEPIDREVMLCYLEDMDAASIGEITGISPANVATKIHRIKSVLSRRLRKGAPT